MTKQDDQEPAPVNDGNTFVFCDHVHPKHHGCARGAGHNGPHVYVPSRVPVMFPLILGQEQDDDMRPFGQASLMFCVRCGKRQEVAAFTAAPLGELPPWTDNPLQAALREAFDYPSIDNLNRLIEAARESAQDETAYTYEGPGLHPGSRLYRCKVCGQGRTVGGTFPEGPRHQTGARCLVEDLEARLSESRLQRDTALADVARLLLERLDLQLQRERAEQAEASRDRALHLARVNALNAHAKGGLLREAEAERDSALHQHERLKEALKETVANWREREQALCRKADAQGYTDYARRLADEAERLAKCADEISALLPSSPVTKEGEK